MPADPVLDALERVIGELPGGGEARAGQRRDGRGRAARDRRAQARRRAGRHRHRQDARLPGAGDPVGAHRPSWPPPPRRCRTSWPARTCRSSSGTCATGSSGRCSRGGPTTCACSGSTSCSTAGKDEGQLALDGVAERAPAEELLHLVDWAATTETGDRAELDVEPSERAWSAVSVSAQECPGAARCPSGGVCFAEAARQRAQEADVVVVNLHLYGLDLAMDGVLLPDHELAIIDEAHQLEDIVSATSGIEVTGGRFIDLARRTRGVIADDQLPAGVDDAGRLLTEALRPHRDQRLRGGLPDDLAGAITVARGRVEQVLAAARNVPDRRARGHPDQGRCGSCSPAARCSPTSPASSGSATTRWCGWRAPTPTRCCAWRRSTCRGCCKERLWDKRTAVLTSATLPAQLPARLGVRDGADHRARCRQPLRLRGARAPLLRRPPARPAQPRLRRGAHRRARRPHRGGRRPHARAVHQLPGARRGRRRPPAALRRGPADPHPARPPQGASCSSASPPTRPPASSPPWASGRASTCPAAA